jgi:hypothetical protein
LIFAPTGVAQVLHVGVSGTRGGVGDEFDVNHQSALGRSQARFIELPFEDGFHAFVVGSLNTQEVGVTVESIRASVQK